MSIENITDQLINKVIDYLKRGELDEPYLITGGKTYTKNNLIYELENKTDFGIGFVTNLMMTTLDLFDRGKEEIDDIKKL